LIDTFRQAGLVQIGNQHFLSIMACSGDRLFNNKYFTLGVFNISNYPEYADRKLFG